MAVTGSMRRAWMGVWTAAALAWGLALGGPAGAADDETLKEVLGILREEGLIDEERHAELAEKVDRRSEKRAWLDRISIWGDFRGRYENFLFDDDPVSEAMGVDLSNRHRARYRLRLDLRGEVNEHATVYVRLASGDDDPRSTNQTLGRGVDFDTDPIRLDLAYATLTPTPRGEICCIADGYLGLDVGKLPNPFVWKELGLDALVFDNDITPEGVALRSKGRAGPLGLFAQGGFFFLDENSDGPAKDPQLLGAQLGGDLEVLDGVTVGARGSVYHYFSLDDDFFARAADGGNLADGLSRRNGSIQILESAAFVELAFFDLFPVQIFGSYAHNLSARTSLASGASRNDDAYLAGLFVGDKRRAVRFGFAYLAVQANALPSMFIDSNVTDGVTNRHGYVWSLQRELIRNVELVYKLFLLDALRDGPAFVDSIPGSDRVRMQVDLKLRF